MDVHHLYFSILLMFFISVSLYSLFQKKHLDNPKRIQYNPHRVLHIISNINLLSRSSVQHILFRLGMRLLMKNDQTFIKRYSLKIWILVLFWLVSFFPIYASQLSNNAEVSVLTVLSGDELYSLFGHTAIRINDRQQGLDTVFNFGTFDFEAPNYYLNFIRGYLYYSLSYINFSYFKQAYIAENRSISEQILNLTLTQKQQILDYLMSIYNSENRFYLYNSLNDNCSTREMDLLITLFGDQLVFPKKTQDIIGKSYKDLLQPYFREHPWVGIGINFILGPKTEIPITYLEQAFLPECLEQILSSTKILKNGEPFPFVRSQNQIYQSFLKNSNSDIIDPRMIFWSIFVFSCLLIIWELTTGQYIWYFDGLLFGGISFLGQILLILWVGTEHHYVENNYHLFWAFPFHGALLIGLISKRHLKWQKIYFLVWAFLYLGILLFFTFSFHPLSPHIIPLLCTLAVRSFKINRICNGKFVV